MVIFFIFALIISTIFLPMVNANEKELEINQIKNSDINNNDLLDVTIFSCRNGCIEKIGTTRILKNNYFKLKNHFKEIEKENSDNKIVVEEKFNYLKEYGLIESDYTFSEFINQYDVDLDPFLVMIFITIGVTIHIGNSLDDLDMPYLNDFLTILSEIPPFKYFRYNSILASLGYCFQFYTRTWPPDMYTYFSYSHGLITNDFNGFLYQWGVKQR
jgi:hypothetical protein